MCFMGGILRTVSFFEVRGVGNNIGSVFIVEHDGRDLLEKGLLILIPVWRVIEMCELHGIVGPEDEGKHRERHQSFLSPQVEELAQAIRTQLSVARHKQLRQMIPHGSPVPHEQAGAIPEYVVRNCGQHLLT